MKFRRDFVTNSSSSSYVCEICGREECGFDLCLSDCEMMECVNGHIFCCDESLEILEKKELIRLILENEWNKECWCSEIKDRKDYTEEELNEIDEDILFEKFCSDGGHYEIPEQFCPICQFVEYSENDLSAYLLKEYNVPKETVFAEVKALNKRRRKLYESEYITYVCQKFNLNPAEIVATWKERFGTYRSFMDWLHG